MGENKRSPTDRRSGKERRETYDLDYFLDGGMERRRFNERRLLAEMRKGWVRVSRWSSKKTDAGAALAASDDEPGVPDEF